MFLCSPSHARPTSHHRDLYRLIKTAKIPSYPVDRHTTLPLSFDCYHLIKTAKVPPHPGPVERLNGTPHQPFLCSIVDFYSNFLYRLCFFFLFLQYKNAQINRHRSPRDQLPRHVGRSKTNGHRLAARNSFVPLKCSNKARHPASRTQTTL